MFVDPITFWHVSDAEKAALSITDYRQAIDRVARTSLREMIGASMLAALLSDREGSRRAVAALAGLGLREREVVRRPAAA